jgi:hypothetical protein
MSTPVPWDWPPEPDRASRRPAQPVLDMHMRVERDGAGHLFQPHRRSLRQRFMRAYLTVMVATAKLIVGALAGIAVAIAIMFLVAIIRL